MYPDSPFESYLASSRYIDSQHPQIRALADQLSGNAGYESLAVARACFHYVRDEIRHSLDFQLNPVTCKASDVLRHGTGYCYAKSHLLAALLRASGIPAGLCYQRLTVSDDHPPYCLHGLNAVYLGNAGWYRMDARGNRPGVNAQFTPPVERLAFALKSEGECDIPGIYAEPLREVTDVLESAGDYCQVLRNLPDWNGSSA